MAKFLIVDDSPFIQKQLSAFLEKHGHEILGVANDGNEGIIAHEKLNPDVMTVDIIMPNKNGKDCLREVIAKNPNAKVIVISAIKDQVLVVECLALGAKAFLSKPLNFRNEDYCEDFLDSIQEAME